jgi:hypothetical protein
MGELLNASEEVFSELKNLCIWNRTNGGMGTFYRSKHELIFVFKVGTVQHVNTFGLGETGSSKNGLDPDHDISAPGAEAAELCRLAGIRPETQRSAPRKHVAWPQARNKIARAARRW